MKNIFCDNNISIITPYEKLVVSDTNEPSSISYPSALSYLFIFTTLFLGVLIRAVMLSTSMCIPYRVIMFSLGGIAGYCAHRFPSLKPIIAVCHTDVDVLLISFLPIFIFITSYNVDSHTFWRSFPQILIVAVPGLLLSSLLTAFMAYYVIETSWNFSTALLFGVVCSPIYPLEMVNKFKQISRGKNLSLLLLGEGLIGDVTTMITFTALFGILSMSLSSSSQVAFLILRYAGGGTLLGITMGKIICMLLSVTYYDNICAIILTVTGAYLTYYIGEKFLYVSGLLGTVIVGVMVSNRKSSMAGDVEQTVSSFWTLLVHIANSLIFAMVGVVISEKSSPIVSVRQISLVFVTYATIYVARLLVYAILIPILRNIGYGITWQCSMACVWGGLRGPLSLCLALTVLETPGVADVGEVYFNRLMLLL